MEEPNDMFVMLNNSIYVVEYITEKKAQQIKKLPINLQKPVFKGRKIWHKWGPWILKKLLLGRRKSCLANFASHVEVTFVLLLK